MNCQEKKGMKEPQLQLPGKEKDYQAVTELTGGVRSYEMAQRIVKWRKELPNRHSRTGISMCKKPSNQSVR
jgi:hypothetical protein